MRTRVDRWGNSLGLRLPKGVVAEAGLREGDSVDIDVENGTITVRRAKPRYTLDELLIGLQPLEPLEEWPGIGLVEPVGKERFWEDE